MIRQASNYGSYQVRSHTDREIWYDVDLCADGGRATCNCAGAYFRGSCSHIREAEKAYHQRVQAFRAMLPSCKTPEEYGDAIRKLTNWNQ